MINLSFDLSNICTRSSPDLSIPDSDRPSLMQMPIHPFTAVIIEAAYYSQQVTTILKSPARAQANPDPASDCYITRVGNLPPLLIRSCRDQIRPDQQQIVSNLCSLYTRNKQKKIQFSISLALTLSRYQPPQYHFLRKEYFFYAIPQHYFNNCNQATLGSATTGCTETIRLSSQMVLTV